MKISLADPARAKDSLIHPRTLMSIRNLELRARVVVEGFWNGLHRSPYHGFSVEFTEYRPYTSGDDPRFLDWRLFARSDRYYIKKFEDETNLRCHLLVDNSRSMTFGSVGYSKADYANTLAATLAYFLNLQGDAVGLMTFDEKIREYLPARHRPGHLRQLMLALDKPAGGAATDLASPLQRIVEMVRRRALVVLISDLLAPIDALDRHLSGLVASGHEVILFHVVDPAESSFNFGNASLFHDVETGRDLYIDPALARKQYVSRFQSHHQSVRSICDQSGIQLRTVSSDHPLELALFEFLSSRLKAGKKIRRAVPSSRR